METEIAKIIREYVLEHGSNRVLAAKIKLYLIDNYAMPVKNSENITDVIADAVVQLIAASNCLAIRIPDEGDYDDRKYYLEKRMKVSCMLIDNFIAILLNIVKYIKSEEEAKRNGAR